MARLKLRHHQHMSGNGQKPYNLLHFNAIYTVQSHLYVDAIVQERYETSDFFGIPHF